MKNRREFIKTVASVAAGTALGGSSLVKAAQRPAPPITGPVTRREVRVGNKRVKVLDIHAHASFPEVSDAVKGTPMERNARGGGGRPMGPDRMLEMDKRGIDVQALDVNTFWWYEADDRDLAAKIVDTQDTGMSKWCAAHSDRFVAFTSPALQFPDLAAQQTEHAVKQLGMKGVAIGGHVRGEPLSMAKYDVFWAKVQELGILCLVSIPAARTMSLNRGLRRREATLSNIIGNPLETIMFFSHLIYDGTLDKFPGLKVIGAHGGGYPPSYSRTDGCGLRGARKREMPQQEASARIRARSNLCRFDGLHT